MRTAPEHLTRMIRAAVESVGYQLVGVELLGRAEAATTLRIYIDSEDGITLDDCAAVSHQVSGMLEVEDPIRGHYDLEVSSPGLDRPLFDAEQFARFKGHEARLKLYAKMDGKRTFVGVLAGVEGDDVLIEEAGQRYRVPLEMVAMARLVPEI